MADFSWLKSQQGPKMIAEASKWIGLKEVIGPRHSREILGWAQYIGGWIASFYNRDEIPWCGLFVGFVAKKCGKPVSQKLLSARAWLTMPGWSLVSDGPQLGDVLVFWRGSPHGSSGHVGFYVGETKDGKYFYVLGGNQDNSVNVTKIERRRLLGAVNHYRWGSPYRQKIVLANDGSPVSENEA